jgi:hypothetical protein
MAIIRQPAYIAQSPLSVAITGTQYPITPITIVPSQAFQIGNTFYNNIGKWASAISFPSTTSTGITALTFADLQGVTGDFLSTNPSGWQNISAPNLVYVGGNFLQVTTLTSFDFSSLTYVGGTFGISTSISTVSFPSLAYVGTFASGANIFSTTISFPALTTVGSFNSCVFPSATTINLTSLVNVNSAITFTVPSCTTLNLPALGTWKYCAQAFSVTTCAFNQTSVDNILAALAYMDGTNGTISFTGTCTITGASCSAPSNAGIVTGLNGSQFVGVGTTCTASIASHGYSIGDVIRVSGVGTLTNANKYATILTTPTTGTFTYAITSQTATGTGVGTVSIAKAGASAKTLVLRGVTLTTN